jgi:hypothetical protein
MECLLFATCGIYMDLIIKYLYRSLSPFLFIQSFASASVLNELGDFGYNGSVVASTNASADSLPFESNTLSVVNTWYMKNEFVRQSYLTFHKREANLAFHYEKLSILTIYIYSVMF